jgi:homoserine/homoserine lactone efflux protein
MDWTVWMMFALTEGALTVSPGPAVLFVVSQGLRCGTADVLWAALGILGANAFYFAISGTGVGALLTASASLFTVIKWAGAGYLVYLGGSALFRREALPETDGGRDTVETGRGSLFFRGFVLQLSNPKALLFFVAILPQFVDTGRPIVVQLLVLGMTSVAMEFVVLAAYGLMAARAARLAAQPRFATLTRRLSGALLLGAAFGLSRLER